MRDARWIELFERYRSQGDVEALARLFDEVAPSLLKVARHIDSRRGEAEDLVQTTFLVAIERSVTYDATRPLVPWLMGILINQSRIARRRRKELVDGGEHETSSESTQHSDMESSELAKAVTKALSELPDTYREVLIAHLQEGKKPRDIARGLGRPQGTVRAQLHRGLRLMRDLLPASFALGFIGLLAPHSLAAARRNVLLEAARRAALAPAAPVAAPRASISTSAGVQGIFVLLVLLAAGVLFWARSSSVATPALDVAQSAHARDAPANAELDPLEAEVRGARATRVRLLAAEPAGASFDASLGSVVVRVGRVGTEEPVAGALVSLVPWSEERWFDHVRDARTRADGSVEFAGLKPGLVGVHVERGEQSRVEVVPGRVVELTVVIHPTLALAGRVVDERGKGVGGAEVALYYANGARTDDAAVVTAPDGRFEFARAESGRFLGARAPDHASSALLALASPTLTEDARRAPVLVVERTARTIQGRVVGPDGAPLAGASLRATSALPVHTVWRADGVSERGVPPTTCASAADGAFALEGLPSGPLDVVVERDGFARWTTRLDALPSSGSRALVVALERGAIVRGRLALQGGGVAGGAEVLVDDGALHVVAEADGRYALRVPSGGHVLRARRSRFAPAVETNVLLADGEERVLDAELAPAPTIRGLALGPAGNPLVGVLVRCQVEGVESSAGGANAEPWAEPSSDVDDLVQVVTNARGEFEVPAYAGRLHTLEARRRAHWRGPVQARVEHVEAGRKDVELVAGARNAWIVGQILESNGSPLAAGQVYAPGGTRTDSARAVVDGANGCFRIGPLFPGAHRLVLCRAGEPPMELGTFDVEANAERDAGPLVLAAPTRVELRGRGPFTLLGADGIERALVEVEHDRWTSERVPTGEYDVLRDSVRTGARVHACSNAAAVLDVE